MNLFCFTLEGSSENIYEPAYSQTVKEVLPKCQCSPVLLSLSEPCLSSKTRPQSSTKLKRNKRRSCVSTSPSDDEALDKKMSHRCWISSGDKKELSRPVHVQNRDRSKDGMLTRDDSLTERTNTYLTAQAAGTAESVDGPVRLKKLQNLVQTKRGPQSGAGKVTSECNGVSNPVLTCIGLGTRTEKKPQTPPPAEQQQQCREVQHPEGEGSRTPGFGNDLWNPQPWTSFYHTCHRPRHELFVCGENFSLSWTPEWDRFESLIQELDSKQSDLSPPPTFSSSPVLQPPQNPEQNIDPIKLKLQRTQTSSRDIWKPMNPSQKKEAVANVTTERGGDAGSRGHLSNSLESLYSLRSGQSSSSGVTSGSDCSSHRDSLRLEDDLLYSRENCGRARVHTDFVPSPYDTESLKLQVGDVIEIIAKPPMGIWTGMLNGRTGKFKFIYVDVLAEESPVVKRTRRQKSTIQEVLKSLSLEEYSSSLLLNGYQTVDDLMTLQEHHLMELNVTDPEHRHLLLAAVQSLKQRHCDTQREDGDDREDETPGENVKAACMRDSGCPLPCNSPEEADLHSIPGFLLPAETTAA